jgi:hypothetical protein
MDTPAPFSARELAEFSDSPGRGLWRTVGFGLAWVLALAFWLFALLILMGS